MRIFDAHCDTIFEAKMQRVGIGKNDLQLDIERMRESEAYIQVFAAFVDKMDIKVSPMRHCLQLLAKYHIEMEKNSISKIETAADLERAARGGVHSILSIEGGEMIEGDLSALYMYFRMGVRLITLTWNYANEIADGITETRGAGLTEFGIKAVRLMEKMGIVIDVSHLSERGFWDVVKNTQYPFVASHSCVKKLCGHKRNLTDEQIGEIISRNGCIGINFYPEFLSDSGECGIEAIMEHIGYILDMNGENAIGLGSDFDGVERLPSGVTGVESMGDIVRAMSEYGISDEIADKIAFGNFYRIFSNSLERADKFRAGRDFTDEFI